MFGTFGTFGRVGTIGTVRTFGILGFVILGSAPPSRSISEAPLSPHALDWARAVAPRSTVPQSRRGNVGVTTAGLTSANRGKGQP